MFRALLRVAGRAAPTLVLVAVPVAWGPVSASATDLGDGLVRLRNEVWDAAAGPPPESGLVRSIALAPDETGAWIVTFRGPAGDGVRGTIEGAGARIEGYVPSNAYLVRATARAAAALRTQEGILRVDRFRPAWKISPEIGRGAAARAEAGGSLPGGDDGRPRLVVHLFADADAAREAAGLGEDGVEVLRVRDGGYGQRVFVRADVDRVGEIARRSAVAWIEEMPRAALRNDTVRGVLQSGTAGDEPLFDQGLLGDGEIIGHIDEPIDTASCFFADPEGDPPGPDHRKFASVRGSPSPSPNFHGTHTAGTLAGDSEPISGPGGPGTARRGMAPKARLAHASFNDLDGYGNEGPSNLAEMLLAAHDDGARIHSNSWGDDNHTDYTVWCLDVDAFTRQHEEDLVVFASTNAPTLRSPENAKNALATRATARAPNVGSLIAGGAGPTADGRRKPEICAPGQFTVSASLGACDSTSSSGTSMSCPAIAGGAALVREYYRRGFYPGGRAREGQGFVPSGALLKATLLNSTVDLAGVPGYPNDREGWGLLRLDDALFFAGEDRRLQVTDVRHADGLSTGDVHTTRLRVLDGGQPLAVTLAYTDRPGTASAALWTINDLDLEVVAPDGTVYLGNFFDTAAGVSDTAGTADPRNNVERVIVAAPETGTWLVRVHGTSVPDGPQGFALAANGGLLGERGKTVGEGPPPWDFDPAVGLTMTEPRPNPFSGEVEVRFTVPVKAVVKLAVFDPRGRLVAVLADRVLKVGEHRRRWDGRDRTGRVVGAGVYFIRIESGGVARTVKAVRFR